MYVCKDCKKTFQEKVEYCDCGNNIFDEIAEPPAESVSRYPMENAEIFKPTPILPANLLSYIVFALCCVCSLCFILFLGPQPGKKESAPITNQKVVIKDVPAIDSFWDDTPAYRTPANMNADWNLYKNGLRNTLLSMFDARDIEGSGSCDIEFILDRHGNLKKKKLYQNTANKSLVSAAKKMLSSVKGYNPPPASYDGKPITLEVQANSDYTYTINYKD